MAAAIEKVLEPQKKRRQEASQVRPFNRVSTASWAITPIDDSRNKSAFDRELYQHQTLATLRPLPGLPSWQSWEHLMIQGSARAESVLPDMEISNTDPRRNSPWRPHIIENVC